MKKFISLLASAALSVSLFAGCGDTNTSSGDTSTVATTTALTTEATTPAETTAAQEPTAEPVDVKVTALKGPTAMGMVQFMDKVDAGEIADNNYSFTIAAAIDEVTPAIVQGKTDIAAVPANVASVLYNNPDVGVEVIALNTLGVIYIVENGDTVKTVEDLRGKTIYASGKGASPEYALNYILSENGIDPATDVTIEWKSEHSECAAALAGSENAIAMLPQPFVTTAQTKNEAIRVALDLTDEWDKIQATEESPSALITGVVVARTEFIENHPEAVAAFLENYKTSVDFVNGNVDEAAVLVGKYDIVPEAVAKKAIPECNIVYVDGADMKQKLSGYLSVLFEQNPKAVGGALPADDFYYGA